jgi:hypothetical protein
MNNLPKDIIYYICKFLTTRDIKSLNIVSKKINRIVKIYMYNNCMYIYRQDILNIKNIDMVKKLYIPYKSQYIKEKGNLYKHYKYVENEEIYYMIYNLKKLKNIRELEIDARYLVDTTNSKISSIIKLTIDSYIYSSKNIIKFINLKKLIIYNLCIKSYNSNCVDGFENLCNCAQIETLYIGYSLPKKISLITLSKYFPNIKVLKIGFVPENFKNVNTLMKETQTLFKNIIYFEFLGFKLF